MRHEHELRSPLAAERGEKRATGERCRRQVAGVTRRASKALGGGRDAEASAP